MHDRSERSIINGLGNELWICNISCNSQLNIDRENIATIPPQIVMWSTQKSLIIIRQHILFLLIMDDKHRGSLCGGRDEITAFMLEITIELFIWTQSMGKSWLVFLCLPLFSPVSIFLAFKLLGAWKHRLWWVTNCGPFLLLSLFSKPLKSH